MSQEFNPSNLTPQNLAGIWGWKISNQLKYDQSGVAPKEITTDDGVQRLAYPISLQSGQTLYHRPEYEWETPTTTAIAFVFSPDGKFEIGVRLESGEMPHGYLLQTSAELGTYTIEGDLIKLNFTYRAATIFDTPPHE